MDTKEVSKLLIEQNQKIVRYEKALAFYANRKNYETDRVTKLFVGDKLCRIMITCIDLDGGSLAQEAMNMNEPISKVANTGPF